MSLGLYKDPLSALNVLCTSHLTTMPSNAARPLSRENSAEEAVILHARRVPLTRDWFNDAASSTDDPAIEEVHAKKYRRASRCQGELNESLWVVMPRLMESQLDQTEQTQTV